VQRRRSLNYLSLTKIPSSPTEIVKTAAPYAEARESREIVSKIRADNLKVESKRKMEFAKERAVVKAAERKVEDADLTEQHALGVEKEAKSWF